MRVLKYMFLMIVIGFIGCGDDKKSSVDNKAPTVNAGKDVSVERNQELILKGIAKDSDGTIESYVWKKGSKVLSTKSSFKYTPTKIAKETLTLIVTDDDGATAVDEVIVNVIMRPFITTWKVDTYDNRNIITIPTDDEETYNYSVDWGDGNISKNQTGSATHIYEDGTKIYTIKISGKFPKINFLNVEGKKYILSIEQWGDIEWSSMAGAFYMCLELEGKAKDTPDLSNVTDMSNMFSGTTGHEGNFYEDQFNSFNQDISDWDVSNVTNMREMFSVSHFNQDIGSWDVSNVTDMSEMFGYSGFNQNINNWDISNVTNMSTMFIGSSFNQNINNWDVSSVTHMSYMFAGSSFNQDISDWDVSNATHMNYMLSNTSFETENYDRLLLVWSQLNLKKNVYFAADYTFYTKDAEASRASIISNFGWKISDAGLAE